MLSTPATWIPLDRDWRRGVSTKMKGRLRSSLAQKCVTRNRRNSVCRSARARCQTRHGGRHRSAISRLRSMGRFSELADARGEVIGPCPRSNNMAIWWDGDLLRELLDGVTITKWDYEHGREQRLFDGRDQGLAANNGSKSNPCLAADIIGDWREELIARTADNGELRIYLSSQPTEHRLITLMHDPQYRIGIAWQNVGYNQPPHPSFFLGHGMPVNGHPQDRSRSSERP